MGRYRGISPRDLFNATRDTKLCNKGWDDVENEIGEVEEVTGAVTRMASNRSRDASSRARAWYT